MKFRKLGLRLLLFIGALVFSLGLVAKPSVFVFTDINLVGGDPDDRQSLVHLLWYADELDIVSVVPDRWNGKGREACQLVIDAYESDYAKYGFAAKGYPSVEEVSDKITKDEEDAIARLKQAVETMSEPLYVLVWGNMRTLKAALFQYPEIASGIRVLSIGTGLKYGPKDEVPGEDCDVPNWNGPGRNDIYEDPRFAGMWWVESNWTYNGGYPKGHYYLAHGGGGYTGKWIGRKATFLEGGIRVPTILSYPKRLPQNAVRDQIVTAMDWLPTLVDLIGIPRPDVKLDGHSVMPLIENPSAPSKHSVLHFEWRGSWATRVGDWKLIATKDRQSGKITRSLHNLADKAPEVRDYASERPEVVARLTALHETWASDVGP